MVPYEFETDQVAAKNCGYTVYYVVASEFFIDIFRNPVISSLCSNVKVYTASVINVIIR